MNNPSCVFEIKIREQPIEGIEAKTEDLIDDPNQSSKLSEIQSSVVNWIKKRIYFDEVYRNWIIYVWSSILRIMGLNEIGCIAAEFWQEIPNHFDNIYLYPWQIMPNHLHGILILCNYLLVITNFAACGSK